MYRYRGFHRHSRQEKIASSPLVPTQLDNLRLTLGRKATVCDHALPRVQLTLPAVALRIVYPHPTDRLALVELYGGVYGCFLPWSYIVPACAFLSIRVFGDKPRTEKVLSLDGSTNLNARRIVRAGYYQSSRYLWLFTKTEAGAE